ncbi:Prp19-domain-containing protein [Ramicandelaber brevisporus]|nr:Prp19-domain-containing protein [Ramicandelaber brevisporus]
MLRCSISGVAPQVPVVSTRSGHVFEKRLILAHLATNDGKCPVTGESLQPSDLVELQFQSEDDTSASIYRPPRLPQIASIPALISTMQDEWDATMLETHRLRRDYARTRLELSEALFQNDACRRVIARLIQERDELRATVERMQANESTTSVIERDIPTDATAQDESAPMDIEGDEPVHEQPVEEQPSTIASFTATDIEQLQASSAAIVAQRKQLRKRKDVEPFAAQISALSKRDVVKAALEKIESQVTAGKESIKSTHVAINHRRRPDTILAASAASAQASGDPLAGCVSIDGKLHIVYGNDIVTHSDSSYMVNCMVWNSSQNEADDMLYIGCSDGSVRQVLVSLIKSTAGDSTAPDSQIKLDVGAGILSDSGAVTGIDIHPSQQFMVISRAQSHHALTVVSLADSSFRAVLTVNSSPEDGGFTCPRFHVDGLLLVASSLSGGYIKLWNTADEDMTTTFNHPSGLRVVALEFAENGYHMATFAHGDGVRIWDLRTQEQAHRIPCSENSDAGSSIHLEYDATGEYLAVSGQAVTHQPFIVSSKNWSTIWNLPVDTDCQLGFVDGVASKPLIVTGSGNI